MATPPARHGRKERREAAGAGGAGADRRLRVIAAGRVGRLLLLFLVLLGGHLHLLPVMLLFDDRQGGQRVIPDLVDLGNHALDGREDIPVGVVRKGHGAEAQEEADPDSLGHVQERLHLGPGAAVEHKHEEDLVPLRVGHLRRVGDAALLVPQPLGAVHPALPRLDERDATEAAREALPHTGPASAEDLQRLLREAAGVVLPLAAAPARVPLGRRPRPDRPRQHQAGQGRVRSGPGIARAGADPEEPPEAVRRSYGVLRHLRGLAAEGIVVVDEHDKLVLVHEALSRAEVLRELRVVQQGRVEAQTRLPQSVQVVDAVLGGARKLLRVHAGLEEGQRQHDHQHKHDHAACRHLGKLLGDGRLGDVALLVVVLVQAHAQHRLVRTLPVELHEADEPHQPDQPDDAARLGAHAAHARCAGRVRGLAAGVARAVRLARALRADAVAKKLL
mmetsp:Transcript_24064/g.74808  ORF Transcript_24064/g.74808 Transcript_24064/m.74808 type:complete len:447 (+) Transcript_24064:1247-2587(+)